MIGFRKAGPDPRVDRVFCDYSRRFQPFVAILPKPLGMERILADHEAVCWRALLQSTALFNQLGSGVSLAMGSQMVQTGVKELGVK